MNEDCLKLTTYFGERHRVGRGFLADAQLDLFGRHAVASSVLLRGAEGFGLKHHLRSDRLLSLSEDLPMVSVAVDTRLQIEAVLDELRSVQQTGLITLERARMLRGQIGPVELPEELHEATKLTVYVGRQERVYRVPAFVAVCDLLHRRGLAGATVLLGVDGTAHGERQRERCRRPPTALSRQPTRAGAAGGATATTIPGDPFLAADVDRQLGSACSSSGNSTGPIWPRSIRARAAESAGPTAARRARPRSPDGCRLRRHRGVAYDKLSSRVPSADDASARTPQRHAAARCWRLRAFEKVRRRRGIRDRHDDARRSRW